MALLAQLENRRNLTIYQPNRCKTYVKQSKYTFEQEVDDFYIDKYNRLYPIFNNTIYALRDRYIMLADNIIAYSIIDTDLGTLFYYIVATNSENTTVKGFRLISREVKEEVGSEIEHLILEHGRYKLLVISQKDYLLYDDHTLHIQFKDRSHKIQLDFVILNACYLENKLVLLDEHHNLQIYDLCEMKVGTGFKSFGIVQNLVACKELNLICINAEDSFYLIDAKYRNIIKKTSRNSMDFTFTHIKFADRRTILLIGEGVWECCLADGSFYAVVQPKLNCQYKYFKNTQGYILNLEFKNKLRDVCDCFQSMFNLKVEMRRELFALNKEVEKLKDELEKVKQKE